MSSYDKLTELLIKSDVPIELATDILQLASDYGTERFNKAAQIALIPSYEETLPPHAAEIRTEPRYAVSYIVSAPEEKAA